MSYYIITIKCPKRPEHDPRNKKTNMCEFSSACSDSTGEHHSFLGTYKDISALRVKGVHITRTEYVSYENIQRVLRDGVEHMYLADSSGHQTY